MATAGYTLVCSVAAGDWAPCPLVFPDGAVLAFVEGCFPGGDCHAFGTYNPGDSVSCEGTNYWAGGGAEDASCFAQFVGPLPSDMTTSDAISVCWAIVAVWAVTWGVRRLIAYAADAAQV